MTDKTTSAEFWIEANKNPTHGDLTPDVLKLAKDKVTHGDVAQHIRTNIEIYKKDITLRDNPSDEIIANRKKFAKEKEELADELEEYGFEGIVTPSGKPDLITMRQLANSLQLVSRTIDNAKGNTVGINEYIDNLEKHIVNSREKAPQINTNV